MKEKKASVTDVVRTVDLVSKLIDLKLIDLRFDTCWVNIEPVIFEGKDLDYKKNWSKNVLTAWFTLKPQKFSNDQQLVISVKGEHEDKVIGFYSIAKGYEEVLHGKGFRELIAELPKQSLNADELTRDIMNPYFRGHLK